jgi:predicted restriction endonuclease
MNEHPITPPPELVEQWMQVHTTKYDLAREAAQWGANEELEACRMEIIDGEGLFYIDETSDRVRLADDIWTARRPKLLSLKQQALQALNDAVKMADDVPPGGICSDQAEIIRRALEQLPDNEKS